MHLLSAPDSVTQIIQNVQLFFFKKHVIKILREKKATYASLFVYLRCTEKKHNGEGEFTILLVHPEIR